MKKLVLLLLVALPIFGAERRDIQRTQINATASYDLNLPFLGGVLFRAGDYGSSTWTATLTTRPNAPWGSAVWLEANPRYHDGVIDVILWRYTLNPTTSIASYCKMLTLTIPAAPNQSVTAPLPITLRPTTDTFYQAVFFESWPGLVIHYWNNGAEIANGNMDSVTARTDRVQPSDPSAVTQFCQ